MAVTDKIKEVLKIELEKLQNQEADKAFGSAVKYLDSLNLPKVNEYNLPLVDTIGKNYYSKLNQISAK